MDWMTWGTWLVAVGTFVLCGGTLYLARQAKHQCAEMRKNREVAEAERWRKTTPLIDAWLESNQNKMPGIGMEMAWFVVGNIGEGAAREVRWWLEGMDATEWNNRWDSATGDIRPPSSPETAAGQQVMPPGCIVRGILWGGESVGKEFTVQIRYTEVVSGKKVERQAHLRPELLYSRGSGEPGGPMKDIKDALKGINKSVTEINGSLQRMAAQQQDETRPRAG